MPQNTAQSRAKVQQTVCKPYCSAGDTSDRATAHSVSRGILMYSSGTWLTRHVALCHRPKILMRESGFRIGPPLLLPRCGNCDRHRGRSQCLLHKLVPSKTPPACIEEERAQGLAPPHHVIQDGGYRTQISWCRPKEHRHPFVDGVHLGGLDSNLQIPGRDHNVYPNIPIGKVCWWVETRIR